MSGQREGSLEAPSRKPIDWQSPDFYDEKQLFEEMERVFDICHGCRRCVSLCNSFPTLFDLVDESETMEVDGVDKKHYEKVVDQCYLCDLCFMTKCPYVPPHPWGVDFPHLMLRAKAVEHKKGKTGLRKRLLTSTDTVGKFAGLPIVAEAVNAAAQSKPGRKVMASALGIHPEAHFPTYHQHTARKRVMRSGLTQSEPQTTSTTRGKVAVFITCYGNRNEPQLVEDLVTVFEHNGILVTLTEQEKCCGMPKLEIGDLEAVAKLKAFNTPELLRLVNEGFDIVAPVPSCVLMFKQEIPLLFADDKDVQTVRKSVFDPFEYLMLRHNEGQFNTHFENSLGRLAYHVPCHQRVQNIGLKTREVLSLVPETAIEVFERCSGHDGTYGVRAETYEVAKKICRPIVSKMKQSEFDHLVSDCPLAGHHIGVGLANGRSPESPFSLLRQAYGL